MMMTVTLKDLWQILLRRKKMILMAGLLLGFLLFAYKLTLPISYTAEGFFKNRDNSEGVETSLSKMLMGVATKGSSSEAKRLMQSRKVLDPLIYELGLQATLIKNDSFFHRILNNLTLEKALMGKRSVMILQKEPQPLRIREVSYGGEIGVVYDISFIDDWHYVVSAKGKRLTEGKLGEKISTAEASWKLEAITPDSLKGKRLKLSISSLPLTAKSLAASIEIEVDRDDTHVLEISYTGTDRFLAAEIVNRLMESYRNYIVEDNEKITSMQINYLHRRQKEVFNKQQELLQSHADTLAKEISGAGFVDAETEVQYLLKKYVEINERLGKLDLQSARLEALLSGVNKEAYQHLLDIEGSRNRNVEELLNLQQQRDSLSLALRQKSHHFEIVDQQFQEQIADLDDLKMKSDQIDNLIGAIKSNDKLVTSPLVDDKKLLVGLWIQRLHQNRNNVRFYGRQKANFLSYLQNLSHLYKVFERVLEERLAFQFHADEEMQGIDLESASKLLLEYNQECSRLECEMHQHSFLAKKMDQPSFDLASLSTTLEDPVSKSVVQKAGEVALLLHDESYRSEKEKDRLRNELDLQRRFLHEHLSHMASLYDLRLDLMQKKIASLQNVMLEQVQQKIVLLEKYMQDDVRGRLGASKLEKEFLRKHLEAVNHEMSHLPQKWISEQLLDQHLELNKAIVEEVTRLVEGKNISHHLAVIRSESFEEAEPPLKPKNPNLLIYLVFGFCAGSFLAGAGVVVRSTIRGVAASQENLILSGFHVSGTLKLPLESESENFTTLRHVCTFVDADDSKPQHVLLIEGSRTLKLAPALADLLKKREKTVAIIDFWEGDNSQYLIAFLEGRSEEIVLQSHEGVDKLCCGALFRDVADYLITPRFKALMEKLDAQYDVILTTIPTAPASAENFLLIPQFDCTVVALKDQSLHELIRYYRINQEHPVTFLVVDP